MNPRIWLFSAAVLGASGVALGAYHAHGLKEVLAERVSETDEVDKRMDNCETAVRYQMYHALALLGVGAIGLFCARRGLTVAGILFTLGVAGFSGGLYLHVFTGNFIHWSIVPAGGLLLIVAWVALAITSIRIAK